MTTLRQVEANRSNAAHSTGPRTDEGKLQSRRNALKHVLSGVGVVLPEDVEAAVQRRMEEWNSSIRPFDAFEMYLFELLCIESVRIDALNADLLAHRCRRADRARTSWDDDRRLEAEDLAANLRRTPPTTATRLGQTAAGCALLIGRWEALLAVLEAGGHWDAAQRALAFDLLGTPTELRTGPTRLGATADRPDQGECLAVARSVVAALRDRAATLAEDDAAERSAAEAGVGQSVTAEEGRARRYLSACRRRFEWARAELRRDRGAPRPTVAAVAVRPAAPAPAPRPTAPPSRPPDPLPPLSAVLRTQGHHRLSTVAAKIEAGRPGLMRPETMTITVAPAPPPAPLRR